MCHRVGHGLEHRFHVVLRPIVTPEVLESLHGHVVEHELTGIDDLLIEWSVEILGVRSWTTLGEISLHPDWYDNSVHNLCSSIETIVMRLLGHVDFTTLWSTGDSCWFAALAEPGRRRGADLEERMQPIVRVVILAAVMTGTVVTERAHA